MIAWAPMFCGNNVLCKNHALHAKKVFTYFLNQPAGCNSWAGGGECQIAKLPMQGMVVTTNIKSHLRKAHKLLEVCAAIISLLYILNTFK